MGAVLDAIGLNVHAYAPYANWGGEYAFVNSGMMMGPAWALRDVLGCMVKEGQRPKKGRAPYAAYDDQLGLARCMFRDPQKITIDYSGSIVLDMWGLQDRIVEGHQGSIRNMATGLTQCFIHVNGPPFHVRRKTLLNWYGPFNNGQDFPNGTDPMRLDALLELLPASVI